jgi:hypothetical protein
MQKSTISILAVTLSTGICLAVCGGPAPTAVQQSAGAPDDIPVPE